MAFGKIKQVKQCFSLFVDNFSVKYFSPDDAQHLINALDAHYGITIDWTSQNYCGLTLDWHYTKGYVDVSMPGYIPDTSQQFQNT